MPRTAKSDTESNTKAPAKKKAASKRPAAKAKPAAKNKTAAKKKAAPKQPRANRSGAGRPSRLSREMILDVSLKLLDQYDVEGFTLARVAGELDTVSMALYNYFPSREALLAELANHICKQFEMPKPKRNQTWQKTLQDWTYTLLELAQQYPMMIKITGMEGKTSAGWLRISRIVGSTLHGAGFSGKQLALNSWLFCCKAIALVQAEVMGGFHSPVSLSQLEELEPEEQEHFLMLRPFHAKITGADVMEQGIADMIQNLESKLNA
ncbi:TetR/AcrR family transcriptional regulator [Litorivivens sp.]|uniref:TetR/AcrR family transcriptional regulator n=1 Tax=Litorivivens sp. TaxID=2020868 RepID=UPI00356AC670